MKKILVKILSLFFNNRISQKLLGQVCYLIHLLMGIGSGAFPSQSGEKAVLRYILHQCPDNNQRKIIFDVGANKGQFLELVLQVFRQKNFQVHCFEPSISTYQILSEKFGSQENIKIANVGLDDHPNQALLYFDQPGSLFASKYERKMEILDIELNHQEVANFTTLDQYCRENDINEISLVKIDVEGNELNVLKGATDLLSKRAISFITFEFGSAQIDSRTFFKDIYYFLHSYGMKSLYRVTPRGYLSLIESYSENLEMFFTTNYFAIMK